jgi:hypothetical protein
VLEWDPVPNASHYAVTVYRFTPILADFAEIVTTNQIQLPPDLNENVTYRWTVQAFHPANTCEEPSNYRSFTTIMSTGIEENNGADLAEFTMFPNPVAEDELLQVRFTSDITSDGFVEIVSATGQILYRDNYSAVQGRNQLQLSVGELPAGMYMLRISGSENNIVRQFVVNK